jgi:nickel transport protein
MTKALRYRRQAVRLFLVGVMLAGNGAHAHDLWLERQAAGSEIALLQGHRSAAHAGEAQVPYAPGFVRQASCHDEQGRSRPLPTANAYPQRLPAGCAALLVLASSGYWTKTAWETKNVPKTGIAGVLRSWRADETVKRLDRWSPALAAPLSAGLEITPVDAPFALAPDDKLRLLVTHGGKPRAGVPVAYDGATRGTTGDDGSIVLRLRRGGLQMISASIETPLADGKADLLIESATLNFELAEKR